MLTLNYRDSRPIYGQIKDGLRKLIVTGALAPNEKLPSVRAMAMELAINPNTIQRAYAELEAEGSFAAMGADSARLRREELTDRLRELIAELRCLQMTDQEIIALIEEVEEQ